MRYVLEKTQLSRTIIRDKNPIHFKETQRKETNSERERRERERERERVVLETRCIILYGELHT